MSTRNLILLLIPLVLLAGLLLAYDPLTCKGAKCDGVASSGIIYDADVQRVVQDFGKAMKQVSLLAPSETVRAEIDAAYGPYVSGELLAAWNANPRAAPGRETSSPWPARINIGQMEGDASGFVVNGTVIEVVNGGDGEEIVGTYPIKVRLKKIEGVWRIWYFEKGDYSQLPARKKIVGTYTCLPHRDTSGPQTMECAFGVREEVTGEHYAVNTQLMSSTTWMDIPTGSRVSIEGVMTPIENLSSNTWQKYDIVGIISATSMQRL